MNKIYQTNIPGEKGAEAGLKLPGVASLHPRGFTLIELLVVVLIIGVLAAAALPQYRFAVARSRMSAMLPLLKSIKDAQERYYMANGKYVDDLNELDIRLPPSTIPSALDQGQIIYPNGTCLDNISNRSSPAGWRVSGGLGNNCGAGDENVCLIYMYYDRSAYPHRVICSGTLPDCARICKTFKF